MRMGASAIMAIVGGLLCSCLTPTRWELEVVATRLDSINLVVIARVETSAAINSTDPPYQAVCLPWFSRSFVNDVVNTTQGDTLHITFTNGGPWIRPEPPLLAWEDGDRSMCRMIFGNQTVGIALTEGSNRSITHVRMRLRGFAEDIVLRIGEPRILNPEPIEIMDVFTGGMAK